MQIHERERLADQPILLANCNSSASSTARRAGDRLRALRAEPAFPGRHPGGAGADLEPTTHLLRAVVRTARVWLLALAPPFRC